MSRILEKLALVPDGPGVYMMRDKAGHIIYIGKAKNLRKRLSSYFKKGAHDAKVSAMLQKVDIFDYFITSSEKDALGLESNLIKKHKPHYNILLKDSKSFPYIRIVDVEFPYLEVTRKVLRGGKYFGPYYNGIRASELVDTLSDIFPIRRCRTMGKVPCVNFQIGRCSAPCAGSVTREDYAKIVDDVKAFLRGEKDFGARLILEEKMRRAAELEQFEVAIRYRNGMSFLDKLKQRTITQVARDVNCDVFGYAVAAEIFAVSVLNVRAGMLVGVQNFANENKGVQSEEEMLSGFINQYYLENQRPDFVVAETEDNPQRALKKRLLDMASANAREYVETSIEKINFKTQFTIGACEQLGEILGIEPPRKIECYDISNLFGEETVASMVVFVDGRAERRLYRRFKIRTHTGIDDYKSMQEVLMRRVRRLSEGDGDESFGTRPDLVIIDGGKGQLGAAVEVVKDIPIISIAKRNEEIFVPSNSVPIVLPRRSYALRLVQRIRDEAHRFAITYHKKLRDKKQSIALRENR